MSDPERIQLRRTKGWRKPPGAVVVARPTKWGNPYPVAEHGRSEAVRLYREHLGQHPEIIAAARRELAGRDLACWCPIGQPCHADVLLDVASTGAFIERHGLVLWTREIGRHYPRDGSCEICGRSAAELAADAKALGYAPKAWLARLVFDHCHKHLIVRGLLCTACNTDMGAYDKSRYVRWGEERRPLMAAHARKCPGCTPSGETRSGN